MVRNGLRTRYLGIFGLNTWYLDEIWLRRSQKGLKFYFRSSKNGKFFALFGPTKACLGPIIPHGLTFTLEHFCTRCNVIFKLKNSSHKLEITHFYLWIHWNQFLKWSIVYPWGFSKPGISCPIPVEREQILFFRLILFGIFDFFFINIFSSEFIKRDTRSRKIELLSMLSKILQTIFVVWSRFWCPSTEIGLSYVSGHLESMSI